MIIHKSSWHYKLLQFFNFDMAYNLCPYIRQVIAASLLAMMSILATIAVVAGAIILASCIIIFPIILIQVVLGNIPFILTYVTFFGSIAYLVSAILLISYSIAYWIKNRPKKYAHKEPSIFIQYVKAKHDKICPRLEFHSCAEEHAD